MTAVTRPALLLAHASPHAVVLPGVQRERQALPADRAAGADRFRLRDLVKGGPDAETGKNSSGLTCRHAASSRQSRPGIVIVWSPGGLGEVVICVIARRAWCRRAGTCRRGRRLSRRRLAAR